ncbi:hypothetical protein PHYSODRAFT_285134 [Phytophthora sojae]|uniref:Uncharacterized protein n=1 Tax=Phytophthora sojae (strain P6497) TaxID=1094619 RepID=G4YUR0_PHYSP|nr:hypothetical protein PHYSODRAFT_285134 [Phytophthora sojae]EGZ25985.1 hypothetical protein PHYSODRAFT_285134 [Phytophthora sojae]|eukprot:XP_009521273.1 hypothetical protein PHYSODRAFT_285134 [Phytophthora sojae]
MSGESSTSSKCAMSYTSTTEATSTTSSKNIARPVSTDEFASTTESPTTTIYMSPHERASRSPRAPLSNVRERHRVQERH